MSDNRSNQRNNNQEPLVSITEYNRMILTQLDNLNIQMKDMSKEMTDKMNEMDQKILKINLREDKIDELVEWKNKATEIVSLSDLNKIKDKSDKIDIETLKELKKEVKELRDFKLKAITVFGFIQVIMTVVTFWQKI
jgi:phage-related protein